MTRIATDASVEGGARLELWPGDPNPGERVPVPARTLWVLLHPRAHEPPSML